MCTRSFPTFSRCPPWAVPLGGICLYAFGTHAVFATETTTSALGLRYDGSVVDARLEQVPVGEALRALARETGLQVNFVDLDIASRRVSVALQAMPLNEAVKAILDGFSYALHMGPNQHGVIVTSTPPRPARTGGKRSPGEPVPARIGPDGEKQGEYRPQTLDDFQPISDVAASSVDGEQEGDSSAQDQAHNEALLERARAALGSEHRNLYEQAIDELSAFEDPRAIDALAQAVMPHAGLDTDIRSRATSALALQALNSQFSDPVSVNALRQLANDNDKIIRGIAVDALREMEKTKASWQFQQPLNDYSPLPLLYTPNYVATEITFNSGKPYAPIHTEPSKKNPVPLPASPDGKHP